MSNEISNSNEIPPPNKVANPRTIPRYHQLTTQDDEKPPSILLQGLLWGGILGLSGAVFNTLSFFLPMTFSQGVNVTYLLSIGLVLVAGFKAAKGTGELKTGLFAGVLTGLLGSIIAAAITYLIVWLMIDTVRQATQAYLDATMQSQPLTNSMILHQTLFASILGIFFGLFVGIGGGTIGGYFGKQSFS